jgi:hypothetical protein
MTFYFITDRDYPIKKETGLSSGLQNYRSIEATELVEGR